MKMKWLLAFLLLIVFISGCLEDGDVITPTYSDNALKMEIGIKEEEERKRILPDQTIRMTVTLTSQVEHEIGNVYLRITDPHAILISKVDCGSGCVLEMPQREIICESEGFGSCTCLCVDSCSDFDMCECSGCDVRRCRNGACTTQKCCQTCGEIITSSHFNGCYYGSIQSLDQEEITFGLKIPSEEQISAGGRELNPTIMLEYDYGGNSALYVPIYESGEKPVEPKKEFTQTTGPIHVGIDSDNWVGEGDLFPIYIDVEDVAHSTEELVIRNDSFEMSIKWADIKDNGEKIGRCDFNGPIGGFYLPEDNITLPQRIPLVCTLRAEEPILIPMVKASIEIDYSYTYRVEKIERIKVEKSLLGIF